MRKPVSLFTRLLFLAAAILVCDVPRAFADEVISGEEALRRKIRAEAKGAADSKPIKIVYAGEKRLAPVVIVDSPEETPMTQEEGDRRVERERRWATKEKVAVLFTATIYDNRYTELQWWSGGVRLRAFVNAGLRDFDLSSIETDSKVFLPGIIVAEEQSGLPSTRALPSSDDIESMGLDLEYLVGYSRDVGLGNPEDYECLEAILGELNRRSETTGSNEVEE